MLHLANHHQQNGQITKAQLRTFLHGTPYHDFMEWLLGNRRMFSIDDNYTEVIQGRRLKNALRIFYEGDRGSSAGMSLTAPASRSGSPQSETRTPSPPPVACGSRTRRELIQYVPNPIAPSPPFHTPPAHRIPDPPTLAPPKQFHSNPPQKISDAICRISSILFLWVR